MSSGGEQRKLERLWNHDDTEILSSFTICRGGDESADSRLDIEVGQTYLFAHPGLEKRDVCNATLDQLWKGIVQEIRHHPSETDAILNVLWFWAKEDIEEDMRNRPTHSDLSVLLDSMAQNELCPGNKPVLNSSDSVSCDVSIVYLESEKNKLRDQEPVVEYFFRMSWDEDKRVIKADLPGCGKRNCHSAWNPDTTEQRYCDICNAWYHINCLRVQRFVAQTTIRDLAVSKFSLQSVPIALCDIAYQPIARGAPTHFPAGNIRIVMKARDLAKRPALRENVTDNKEWEDEEWEAYLNDHFGLEAGSDDPNVERLHITNQKVYECPCGTFI